ncbi:MAG: DUF1015 domain-containing protein [Candidatus Rariloculaceae bacterium]
MTTLVKPFAALRPEAEHAATVVAPPYDVVSRAEAQALASEQPNSFLHISRPEIDLPDVTDVYADEVYAQGARNLERLTALGLLTRDESRCYYVYRMRMGNHEQTGVALTASVAAYDANRVRKHERTRPEKENDRVRNIASLNAQTGPVLSVYRADAGLKSMLAGIKQTPPLLDVVGQYDVAHTLWKVDDPDQIASISAAFEAMNAIYIADGHHRSAAASRVAADRGAGSESREPANADFFLTVVFPHEEMNILDYNRVVKDLDGLSSDELLARLGQSFDIQKSDAPVKPELAGRFGMYLDGNWYRLTIHPDLVPESDPVGQLDVSLLQERILSPVLNVGDPRLDPRVDFVGGIRGLQALEDRVDRNEAAIAFSLFPTSMEQLMAVADAEELMPPKSTWFEPKLADGLLTHVLD